MWVSVEQTALDLLVVLVVITFQQPSAVINCAKYNIVPLTSLIPLCGASGPQQTLGPHAPLCAHSVRQPCAASLSCANSLRYAIQRINGHN